MMGVGVVQTYKQKAERPDIIAITLCPGWVKTGTLPPYMRLKRLLNDARTRYWHAGCAARACGERRGHPEGDHVRDCGGQREVHPVQWGDHPVVRYGRRGVRRAHIVVYLKVCNICSSATW